MSLSTQEILFNAGNLLTDISEAISEDSDGGVKITFSELINIVKNNGIAIYDDTKDNDDIPGQPETK